jgi:hypothetical protein
MPLFAGVLACTRRKDCPKRLCHNDLNCPQRLIFSRFSVIVDNFSRCGIVVYSSFSSSDVRIAFGFVKDIRNCGRGSYGGQT